MRLLVAASALILIALPGTASRRDPVPAATPAGKPVDCLRLADIRETRVRDGRTIDFITRGKRVYRNTLDAGACPDLAFEERFAYKTHTGQLCSVDIITVLQGSGIAAGASCGLGKFQPVTLAAH